MSLSLHTPLCDLLGVRLPVVLAGMAGGATTPELVAAVARAGGLGTFGAMGMSPDGLAEAVTQAQRLGASAVGVNVLLAPATQPTGDPAAVRAAIDKLGAGLRRDEAPTSPPAGAAELVAAGIDAGASVISVGLGDPTPVASLAHDAGLPLIAMAATVDDAVTAVAAGADAIVAQGSEAGGHRSNFEVGSDGSVPLVGAMALVPQVVDAVDVPVVAAGGIMDGRGLVAARALGAQGVQMGTRFLVSLEAGISPGYKERVHSSRDDESIVTSAVSGRPARGLPNALVRSLETTGESAGWPAQAVLSGELRSAAHRADRADLLALWAGQAAGLAPPEMSAEDILASVESEARALLGSD